VAERLKGEQGNGSTGFEILDHTADYALRAWGSDLARLIEGAAAGMLSLMVEREGLRPAQEVEVEVAGEDDEELLHHALRELLYLFEDGQVPLEVAAKVEQGGAEGAGKVQLRVGIVPLEQVHDRVLGHIKAVTYHGLQVRREGGRLVTQIVLDT